MTRRDLLQSSASFVTWFLVCAVASMATLAWMEKPDLEQAPFMFGVFFVLMMLGLMMLFGAIYMLLRGVLRSADYVPPSEGPEQES